MEDGVSSLDNDVYDALRALTSRPEFRSVSLPMMIPVVRNGVRRTFAPGAVIVEHGRHSDSVYLLLKGRVRVERTRDVALPHRLAELQAGDFVGEMGTLTGVARSATARAIDEVEALEMSEHELQRGLRHDHPFLVALLQLMNHRYHA
jgi:CRP-like cAMP-binding protein